MRRLVCLLVGLAVLALARPALAHRMSLGYVRVDVAADGEATLAVQLSSRDLYEVLGLDRDRDATDGEITGGAARLLAYVTPRLAVAADGAPCPLSPGGVDVVTQTDRFARVTLRAACPARPRVLTLEYDLFFELDPAHTALVELHAGDEVVRRELGEASARLEWTLGHDAPDLGLGGFVRSGVHHIFTGFDHLAFLVSLLLVVVLAPGGGPRPLRAALTEVLATVTAFTVAHSATLIAAALGWVRLPSALVESAIAASIVFVAVENLVRRSYPRRFRLAFVFGLIHGVGFASMLAPLLPPSGVVAPLLCFNLGVELGQLAVVAVVLPILALGARHPRYRLIGVQVGSGVLGALGLVWLIERVFDVTLLGL